MAITIEDIIKVNEVVVMKTTSNISEWFSSTFTLNDGLQYEVAENIYQLYSFTPVQVHFGGKRYYSIYDRPDILYYPSVTTVLGHYKQEDLFEWRESIGEKQADYEANLAARYGTDFHRMIAELILTRHTTTTNIITAENIRKILPHFRKMNKINLIESVLISHKLKLAGTTDFVGEYCNKHCVLDFKTSSREKYESEIESYFTQASAYSYMYEEMTGKKIEDICILMINPMGVQEFWSKRRKHQNYLIEAIRKFTADYPSPHDCNKLVI